ncbi:hypothetical protein ACROYT_G020544 [Oculina patagonica]
MKSAAKPDGYRSLVFIYHKNKASSCKLDQETVMARSNSLFVLLVVALSLTLGAESRLYRPLLDEGDDTEEVETDYLNLRDDTEMVGADYINLPTCGKATAAGSRVIAGTDATPGEWPWQAKLRTKEGFFCGGSLITPTWVMTAAHCVSGSQDPSKYTVTLGDVNREKPEGTEQEFNVIRVVVHPKYESPVAINNDIALLQLAREASKTSFVNTVCLPEEWRSGASGDQMLHFRLGTNDSSRLFRH